MNNEDIDFTQYNRITDTLMYFSETMSLNFTVSLSKTTKMGTRQFFQFETKYGQDPTTGDALRSIKRTMNFFFTIQNKDVFESGMILRPQDVEILLRLIDAKIFPWFFGNQKQIAFQIIENKLVLKEYSPVIYTQSDTKYLTFEPMVFTFDDNTYSQGIRMRLASGDLMEMNIDKFMGFYHLLKTDMYSAACNMVTYVKTPPYGVNNLEIAGGLGSARAREDFANRMPSNYMKSTTNSFLNNAKSK